MLLNFVFYKIKIFDSWLSNVTLVQYHIDKLNFGLCKFVLLARLALWSSDDFECCD